MNSISSIGTTGLPARHGKRVEPAKPSALTEALKRVGEALSARLDLASGKSSSRIPPDFGQAIAEPAVSPSAEGDEVEILDHAEALAEDAFARVSKSCPPPSQLDMIEAQNQMQRAARFRQSVASGRSPVLQQAINQEQSIEQQAVVLLSQPNPSQSDVLAAHTLMLQASLLAFYVKAAIIEN